MIQPEIFISYRRRIDGEAAARLAGELRGQFGDGQVFLDTDHHSIPPGTDFPTRLEQAIEQAKVILVVSEPVTDILRATTSIPKEISPWVVYWCLQKGGGNLDWTRPLTNRNTQVELNLVPDVLATDRIRG